MPSTLFSLFNLLILPFWLLLIFAPRWRGTQRVVHSAAVFVLLGGVYLGCLFAGKLAALTSLESAMTAFQDPWLFLAGWTHYLCFDLMVGAWLARDAQRLKLSHWLVVPSLLLTLNLGPVGFALYLSVRALTRRRLALQEI